MESSLNDLRKSLRFYTNIICLTNLRRITQVQIFSSREESSLRDANNNLTYQIGMKETKKTYN